MIAATASDTALLITAISAAIIGIIGAVFAGVASVRAGRVETQVKTMNELTVGQMATRDETRRVQAIDPAYRTPQEERHLAMDVLDPNTRGVTQTMRDRKAGGDPGSAKADDQPVRPPPAPTP